MIKVSKLSILFYFQFVVSENKGEVMQGTSEKSLQKKLVRELLFMCSFNALVHSTYTTHTCSRREDHLYNNSKDTLMCRYKYVKDCTGYVYRVLEVAQTSPHQQLQKKKINNNKMCKMQT